MSSKFFAWSLISLLAGLLIIFGSYEWFLEKQERVLAGTARPEFPYGDYSLDELNKLYPQYPIENIPTTQTPEQTHQKFLAALKKGDFDEAVNCCFREGDREKMKKSLEEIKAKGYLDEMTRDLSAIEKDVVSYGRATYIYSGTLRGQKIANFITFFKNNQGVWLIGSL